MKKLLLGVSLLMATSHAGFVDGLVKNVTGVANAIATKAGELKDSGYLPAVIGGTVAAVSIIMITALTIDEKINKQYEKEELAHSLLTKIKFKYRFIELLIKSIKSYSYKGNHIVELIIKINRNYVNDIDKLILECPERAAINKNLLTDIQSLLLDFYFKAYGHHNIKQSDFIIKNIGAL